MVPDFDKPLSKTVPDTASVLNRYLENSTAVPYANAMTTEENAAPFRQVRRLRKLRRGEPRKSARGHITRFAPRGRWLRVEGRPNKQGRQNAELWALHATKGWRRVPVALADYLQVQAAAEQAKRDQAAAGAAA